MDNKKTSGFFERKRSLDKIFGNNILNSILLVLGIILLIFSKKIDMYLLASIFLPELFAVYFILLYAVFIFLSFVFFRILKNKFIGYLFLDYLILLVSGFFTAIILKIYNPFLKEADLELYFVLFVGIFLIIKSIFCIYLKHLFLKIYKDKN